MSTDDGKVATLADWQVLLLKVLHWGMNDIPPGPKFIPLYISINLQKVGTPFYLVFLMWYYQNYSPPMLVYAALHGTYGCMWYVKHRVFPDPSLLISATFMCHLVCFVLIIGPYMIPAYLLASRTASNETQTPMRLFFSSVLYIFGLVMTLLSDMQKSLTLKMVKERPILIQDGMYKYTRSPNYLGEMMLYWAFASVVNHWLAYSIIIWSWLTIFLARGF